MNFNKENYLMNLHGSGSMNIKIANPWQTLWYDGCFAEKLEVIVHRNLTFSQGVQRAINLKRISI